MKKEYEDTSTVPSKFFHVSLTGQDNSGLTCYLKVLVPWEIGYIKIVTTPFSVLAASKNTSNLL